MNLTKNGKALGALRLCPKIITFNYHDVVSV